MYKIELPSGREIKVYWYQEFRNRTMKFEYRNSDGTINNEEREYDKNGTVTKLPPNDKCTTFYHFADGTVLSAEDLQKKIDEQNKL